MDFLVKILRITAGKYQLPVLSPKTGKTGFSQKHSSKFVLFAKNLFWATKIKNGTQENEVFRYLLIIIRESGDSESFSQVVSDVEKVRSLFKSTNVKVFKIVMDELETAVMELQKSLHSQLFDGKNMAQQHQIVRQLIGTLHYAF